MDARDMDGSTLVAAALTQLPHFFFPAQLCCLGPGWVDGREWRLGHRVGVEILWRQPLEFSICK